MRATLTELRRNTGRLLGAVLQREESVTLTQHGKTVAELRPRPQPVSGEEFAKLWSSRTKLDKATAESVAQNIARLRESECGS
jgi:prevent-host-death family protein